MNIEIEQNPGFKTDPKYKGDVTIPMDDGFKESNTSIPEEPLTAERTEVVAPTPNHSGKKRVSPLLIVGGIVALLLFAKR